MRAPAHSRINVAKTSDRRGTVQYRLKSLVSCGHILLRPLDGAAICPLSAWHQLRHVSMSRSNEDDPQFDRCGHHEWSHIQLQGTLFSFPDLLASCLGMQRTSRGACYANLNRYLSISPSSACACSVTDVSRVTWTMGTPYAPASAALSPASPTSCPLSWTTMNW